MCTYLAKSILDLPVIALQFVKVKSFRGKIGIQNVMLATRILFDPVDIESVVNFKNSISTAGMPLNFNILNEQAPLTIEEDFMKFTPRGTIGSLIANKESGSFIIMGKINALVQDDSWWYPACKCGRSVLPDSGMYVCDVCEMHMFTVFPRFKVKLEVEDETGTGIFVIFERDCASLMKKSCADFFMEHMSDPEAVGGNNYPLAFTELHGKKLLFKIDTKVVSPNRYNGTFRVRRICDDETVLAMFSLKGANLTPSKAIFTSKLTPALSMGDFYGVSLGDSTAVNLADDNVANLGDDSGLKMIPESYGGCGG